MYINLHFSNGILAGGKVRPNSRVVNIKQKSDSNWLPPHDRLKRWTRHQSNTRIGNICAMVKSRYIGDGHLTFNRNPYNGYINPYYWVEFPIPYGNNGSWSTLAHLDAPLESDNLHSKHPLQQSTIIGVWLPRPFVAIPKWWMVVMAKTMAQKKCCQFKPPKSYIDTKNPHSWKQWPLSNHHFQGPAVSFRECNWLYIYIPGTPNNQIKMDVWWNNHFL